MIKQIHPVSIACALRASLHFLARPQDHRQVGPNRTEFICWAVDRAVQKGLVDEVVGHATKHMIEQRLLPHNNVYTWLVREGHYDPVLSQDEDRDSFAKVQGFRHRWVEALAKEHFAMGENISDQLRLGY